MDDLKFTIMRCDDELVYIDMNYAFKKLNSFKVYDKCPQFIKDCIMDFEDKYVVYEALVEWLKGRTIPDERIGRDDLIRRVYGLNPNFTSWLTLLTVDHGVSVLDDYWIKFSDEDIKYADVRVKF